MGIYDGLEEAADKKSKQTASYQNLQAEKDKIIKEIKANMKPLVKEGLEGFVAMAIKAGNKGTKRKKDFLWFSQMISINLWSFDRGIYISKDGKFWKENKTVVNGIYRVKDKEVIDEVTNALSWKFANLDVDKMKRFDYEALVKDYFAERLGLGKIKDNYVK